jgi:integral membrane protein
MTLLLVLRLVKFAGLALFGAGVYGALAHRDGDRRQWAAYWLAIPGFLLTATSGWLLLRIPELSSLQLFVLIGTLGGALAMHGSVMAATSASWRPASRALAAAGLLGAVDAMVLRAMPAWILIPSVAAVAAGGASLALLLPRPSDTAPSSELLVRWFWWMARAEGLSLAFMMLVAMPIRAATDFSLDGDTGAIGFVHGLLVLCFLQALLSARRPLGVSWGWVALAFFASLLPLGTIGLELWASRSRRVLA